MSSTPPDFIEDGALLDVPTNSEMAEISSLGAQQQKLELEVARAATVLATLKDQLAHVTEVALPSAMAAVGVASFTLSDGSVVSVKDDVYPSIRANCFPAAASWLDSRGLGDVVKSEIKVKLGRGESKHMTAFLELGSVLSVDVRTKQSVHPGTLKALVKEQRSKGVDFPEEFFSIFDKQRTIIKKP